MPCFLLSMFLVRVCKCAVIISGKQNLLDSEMEGPGLPGRDSDHCSRTGVPQVCSPTSSTKLPLPPSPLPQIYWISSSGLEPSSPCASDLLSAETTAPLPAAPFPPRLPSEGPGTRSRAEPASQHTAATCVGKIRSSNKVPR